MPVSLASASQQLHISAGASIQLHAVDAMACSATTQLAHEQVYDVLARGLPVSVTVDGLGDSRLREKTLRRACEILRSAVRDAHVDSGTVSIVIDADLISPRQAFLARSEILGPGPVYLLLGSSLLRPSDNEAVRQRQEHFWQQCWKLRNTRTVRTAFAPLVTSSCPLLSSEVARGVLPPMGLQVPLGTAWIPIEVDLAKFANVRGALNELALREYLQRCVELGESFHDDIDWPTAAMRHDSWLNRRIAITVTGIGNLTKLRSMDPRSFTTLKELSDMLEQVRGAINDHSRQLALQKECLPALDLSDPSRGPGCDIVQLGWQKRWRKALDFAAVRHRNLLAMSPWAVFPTGTSADSSYSDLLPLLEFFDVCGFPGTPCLRHWKLNEYKDFHRRAWAVLERKDARQLFAEHV
jgi:hypothetical protein